MNRRHHVREENPISAISEPAMQARVSLPATGEVRSLRPETRRASMSKRSTLILVSMVCVVGVESILCTKKAQEMVSC
ncbi:hypothetical protein I7I48_08347 [Histoplasma ohiense]|nr:hypothetical protein I7I48_08347 [Histoplasma ohiense (nom. inval.)]